MTKEDKIHFYELYKYPDLLKKLFGWWNNLQGISKGEEGKRNTENRKIDMENRKIDMENWKKERSGR